MLRAYYNPYIFSILLSVLIFVGGGNNIFPQDNSNIDSLLYAVQTAHDSSKVNILLKLSNEYAKMNQRKSINYATSALRISKKIYYKPGIFAATKILAYLYLQKEDILVSLGYYQKLLQTMKSIDDQQAVSDALYDIGSFYFQLGNYKIALEYLQQSLKIREPLKNNHDVVVTLTKIATVYARENKYNIAVGYYRKALSLLQSNEDIKQTGRILISMGNIYITEKKYTTALLYLKRALEKFDQINDTESKIFAEERIGMVYTFLFNFKAAEKYLLNSLKESSFLKDSEEIAQANNLLANTYVKSGDINKANEFAKKGLKIGKDFKNKVIQRDAIKILSAAYAKKNNFKKAYELQAQANELSDSITIENSARRLTGIQSSYEGERQNLIIQLQNAELNREKQIIYFIFGGFAISVFLSLFLFKLYRDKHKINELLKTQKESLTKQQEIINKKNNALAESNAVKDKLFTIIAHDLRNPFWTLKGLLELLHSKDLSEEDFKELIKRLGKRIESMEVMLENLLNWASSQKDGGSCSPEVINLYNLTDEIFEFVKRSADEKHIQLINNIDHIDKAYADVDMIRLVIRNLVTNAVKFTNTNGKIEINSNTKDGKIEISVCDNGIGIPGENLNDLFNLGSNYSTNGTAGEKGSGLGLGLCKEFVEKNGGKIWVNSKPGSGSQFTFSLERNKESV